MAKKQKKNFDVILKEAPEPAKVDISQPEAIKPDGKISVNLKYYQKKCECFSEWQKRELKAFSAWLVKMSASTPSQITSVTKNCHSHVGKKRGRGFVLPESLSEDLLLYGIDVGPAQRVHGFFEEETFYLVWLDRQHKCFS